MKKIDVIMNKINNMTDEELKDFIINEMCVKEFGFNEYNICNECMCQHCWYEEI